MMKYALIFLCVLSLFVFGFSQTKAAVINVDSEGTVVVNVLSSRSEVAEGVPENEAILVKEVADFGGQITDARISLSAPGGDARMNIDNGKQVKEFSVGDEELELIEIEERPKVQPIFISYSDNKFSIKQQGYTAHTSLALNIDPKQARISANTGSGEQYLFFMPGMAAMGFLRTRLVTTIERSLELKETEEGDLVYRMNGEKIIRLFDFDVYKVPVAANVSASTGEIVSVEAAQWYRLLGNIIAEYLS